MTCTVDLGGSYFVGLVRQFDGNYAVQTPLIFSDRDCTTSGIQSAEIDVSADGVTWTTVSTGLADSPEIQATPNLYARYLRTTVSACWQTVGIYTLAAYGTDAVPNGDASIPTPPTPDCSTTNATVAPVSSAGTLPDGGFAFEFDVQGVPNVFLVPPSGFNPVTATDAQLAEYGWQPRPTDPQALQTWASTFGDYAGVPLPELCISTSKVHVLDTTSAPSIIPAPSAGPSATTQAGTSANWGGRYTDSSSNSWVAAQGDWYQSRAISCGCGSTDTDESTWTGLGGVYGNRGLLQEGTDMQGPSTIYPWYEYLHNCPSTNPNCNVPELQIKGLSTVAGDHIHTYTAYQTSTGKANFLVCASGHCQPVNTTLNSTYYNGQSTDYIDERPSYCATGCYKFLTNFEYNNWFNTQAYTTGGTWQNAGSDNNVAVNMVDTKPRNLVSYSKLAASTFTDTWNYAS